MDASALRPRSSILALTSEVELHRLLRSILEPNGYKVLGSTLSLEDSTVTDAFDIVIVDLESISPHLISQARRRYPSAQIIEISGARREADCIAALDAGGDYLPRPFRAEDLSARVRVAELRRFKALGRRRFYRRGSFVIDLLDRKVALAGKPISLAPSALTILMVVAGKAGRLATFADILAGLGRADSASGRQALNSSVFRLRRRIERDPEHPDLLLTETGVGYRLAPETDDATPHGLPRRRREPEKNRSP
jgi:two-component system, OmpR family, KDP operon response regulator KdpE